MEFLPFGMCRKTLPFSVRKSLISREFKEKKGFYTFLSYQYTFFL